MTNKIFSFKLNLFIFFLCFINFLNKLTSALPINNNEIDNSDDAKKDIYNKNNDNNINFILIHNNDLHSRFEQTNINSNKCSTNEGRNGNCYGGFARIAYVVKKLRQQSSTNNYPPVLYLNAGDTYSGTVWFSIFKDKIVSELMNAIKPNAMSLGNHEFDKGIKGLIPFLNSVNFPIVTANLNLTNVPQLQNILNLKKSIIHTMIDNRNNVKIKIGIVGYLTPDTKKSSSTGDVDILPEIDVINKEALKLKNDGIKIIIALGHSGIDSDKEIALNCPDIDLVVGGHTNTFLYNGKSPSSELASDQYPIIVTQPSNKKVPVVQAYAYGKYLGYLNLTFDPNGDLISFNGNPILLDSSIPEDPEVLNLLSVYRPNVTALSDDVIGKTEINLDGSREKCRKGECVMGNVLADAMIYARQKQLNAKSDAVVSFVNSGGIRSSIEKKSDGAITSTDVLDVVPFNNSLYVATIKGDKILSALELSASNYYHNDLNGGFLQLSGIQVVYDMSQPIGERVINIKVLNPETNQYEELNVHKNYKIILTKFLLKGGDGYNWYAKGVDPLLNAEKINSTDYISTIDFIKEKGPIKEFENQRIILV